MNLGIFLAGLTFCLKDKKKSFKRWSCGLLLVGILGLGYLDFLLGGIHIRYVCDLSLAVSLLAFLLILEHIHFEGTRSSHILYVMTLGLLLLTVGRGWLTIFSNETNAIRQANPDFYLSVARMFRL